MRNTIIAGVSLALFACGGTRTITATPQIKSTVTDASSSMTTTNSNVSTSVAVQTLGANVASAGASGNVGGVDISGMPDPSALPKMQPKDVVASVQAAAQSAATTSSNVSGCIQASTSNGTTTAVYVAAGSGSCTATDHLEIDYANGDVVWITQSGSSTSFTLTFAAKAGKWVGTSLTYVVNQTSSTAATLQISGAIKFSGTPAIDATFNFQYAVNAPSADQATVTYSGSVVDAIGKHSYNGNLGVDATSTSTTSTVHLTANTDLAVLDANLKPVHTVSLVGFDVTVTATSNSASYQVAGNIEYDGAIVGTLKIQGGGIVIAWTDGTTSPFDPSLIAGK